MKTRATHKIWKTRFQKIMSNTSERCLAPSTCAHDVSCDPTIFLWRASSSHCSLTRKSWSVIPKRFTGQQGHEFGEAICLGDSIFTNSLCCACISILSFTSLFYTLSLAFRCWEISPLVDIFILVDRNDSSQWIYLFVLCLKVFILWFYVFRFLISNWSTIFQFFASETRLLRRALVVQFQVTVP